MASDRKNESENDDKTLSDEGNMGASGTDGIEEPDVRDDAKLQDLIDRYDATLKEVGEQNRKLQEQNENLQKQFAELVKNGLQVTDVQSAGQEDPGNEDYEGLKDLDYTFD